VTGDVAVARSAARYVLSALSSGMALLAWQTGVAGTVGTLAVLFAASAVAGPLAGAATASSSPGFRERARLLGLLAFAGLATVGMTAALAAGPDRMPRVVAAYAALQPLLVLFGDLARTQSVVAANALLLTLLTVAAGGPWAVAAVIGYLGVLPFLLAFDHAAHTLAAWPPPPGPVAPAVFRATARLAGPIVLGLALYFVVAPADLDLAARTAAGQDPDDAAAMVSVWRRLVLLGILGVGLLLPLVRLLRAGTASPTAVVGPELLDGTVVNEEILPAPPSTGAVDASARGRVVASYLRVLRALVRRGFDRRASQTPQAIARRAAPVSAELQDLTALFMDARYGPAEPTEDEARRAEDQARTLGRLLSGPRLAAPRPRPGV
jgi:hypothetical protein